MNILKAFKKPSTTQIELGSALLKSVTNEDYVRYSDAQISDLLHGKKNVGDSELTTARSCIRADYLQRFNYSIIPLLDANEVVSIVAALRHVIADDQTIRKQTIVDSISGLSKERVVYESTFVATEFLAGLFLYALTNVENRGTSSDASEIDETFIETVRVEADGITLIDSWSDATSFFVDIWKSGPNSISLVSGDIFEWPCQSYDKALRIVVIPVDTSFCMHLSSGIEGGNPFLVSERTLHGKFLTKWEKSGETITNLKQRIKIELDKAGACRDNNGHYPIGTIAVIEKNRTAYCLLAISQHDKFGNTQSSEDDIRHAIETLILFYDRKGLGYPLLIPFIGTGRSRSGLNPQCSLELILNCFMRNRCHIQGEIVIIAQPSVIGSIDIEKAKVCCGLQD